jgi:hypothetical protein
VTATAEDDLADLLPDELMPSKGKARPLVRSKRQAAKIAARQQAAQEAQALEDAKTAADAAAARVAQIANLVIAGYSLAHIGASIGMSEAEVEKILSEDSARYIRSQPALRVFVRNFISEKYNGLLEAVWNEATDRTHAEKLEHQDRALRILKEMARLHGAEAPTQAEIKMEASSDAVDAMVAAISAAAGKGYDTTIFDVVPGEVVHEAHEETQRAVEVSRNRVADG